MIYSVKRELPIYLYRSFPRDVGHQEVHGDVLAVHMSIHPVLNVARHLVRVQIIKVLPDQRKNEIRPILKREALFQMYRVKILDSTDWLLGWVSLEFDQFRFF